MKMEEGTNNQDFTNALDWMRKIEIVSGLKCVHLSEVLSCDNFTLEELLEAQERDRLYFKGLIEDIAFLI